MFPILGIASCNRDLDQHIMRFQLGWNGYVVQLCLKSLMIIVEGDQILHRFGVLSVCWVGEF